LRILAGQQGTLRLMQAARVPQLAVGEGIVPTLKRRRFAVAGGFSNVDAAYRWELHSMGAIGG